MKDLKKTRSSQSSIPKRLNLISLIFFQLILYKIADCKLKYGTIEELRRKSSDKYPVFTVEAVTVFK